MLQMRRHDRFAAPYKAQKVSRKESNRMWKVRNSTHHLYRGTFLLSRTFFSWHDNLWKNLTSAVLLQSLGNVVLSTSSISWGSWVCLMRFHRHLHCNFLLPAVLVRKQEGSEIVVTAKNWLQDVCGLFFFWSCWCFKRESWQEWCKLCRLYSATT